MSAFEDEILGLIEDVKRYSMGDARIELCLDEMLKRITAEVDALAFEAAELEKAVVRQTSRLEAAHIHDAASRKQWGTWNERAG